MTKWVRILTGHSDTLPLCFDFIKFINLKYTSNVCLLGLAKLFEIHSCIGLDRIKFTMLTKFYLWALSLWWLCLYNSQADEIVEAPTRAGKEIRHQQYL